MLRSRLLRAARVHPRAPLRILAPLLVLTCAPRPAFSGEPATGGSGTQTPPMAFTGGFDTRIREETLHNLIDFNDDTGPGSAKLGALSDASYFRVRHRLWGQFQARSGARLYARFATEWRKYMSPYRSPAKTEVIIDNLYLDLPKPFGWPLSLRVGRQDITRGDGFVLLEGGPGDGSRSIFHNAVLLTLDGAQLGAGKTQIDLMAIRNPAWDDFVVTNGPTEADRYYGRRKMVENDETAFGVYMSNTSLKHQTFDAYYLYKEEEDPASPAPQLMLSTLGARAAGQLPWQLRYAAEGAYQFGQHEVPSWEIGEAGGCWARPDHRSFGGTAGLSRSFLMQFRPTLELGAIYLSGDDPADTEHPLANDRSWVPVFARWPKWSELLIYTWIPEEGRVANWSNLISFYASLGLTLAKDTKLTYTYYHLKAPYALVCEEGDCGQPAGFFGSGHTRGENHQWKLTTTFSSAFSGHFLVERFAPGDFYGTAHDDAFFIRWELTWKL
jgi:hypothetical protein